MIKQGMLWGMASLLLTSCYHSVFWFLVRFNEDRVVAVHILHSSTFSSTYGHFWLQKAKMPTAIMSNCNVRTVVHKPMGDITVGLHLAQQASWSCLRAPNWLQNLLFAICDILCHYIMFPATCWTNMLVYVLLMMQRVMPTSFFLLLRFFLRVDRVLIRINDTRLYHEASWFPSLQLQ